MDILLQYNQIGKDYIKKKKEFFSKEDDEAIKFIKKVLPQLKNKIVLDIGCGDGLDMRVYYSLGAKEVYGVDPSQCMINEARRNTQKPETLFVANIEKTPFKDKFFDIAIGRYSLHYLSNFEEAYKEISRILKPKGVMLLVVDHPLRDLMNQKKKKYGRKEIIKVKIYHHKVPLHFPSHTLKEYLSKTFFDLFYLDYFEEGYSPESRLDKHNTPDFMGIKCIKK